MLKLNLQDQDKGQVFQEIQAKLQELQFDIIAQDQQRP